MKLSDIQAEDMRSLVDAILTGAHYAFLPGLGGAANIGGVQQDCEIRDENRIPTCLPGELEVAASDGPAFPADPAECGALFSAVPEHLLGATGRHCRTVKNQGKSGKKAFDETHCRIDPCGTPQLSTRSELFCAHASCLSQNGS